MALADRQYGGVACAERVFAPAAHRHLLVIPVINEGARILAQLDRIRAAALPVDVMIADGGSTDGSMEPAGLVARGVRALLVKTGPGALSAQLRMAYGWALAEGYEGVVTIDGNGKDGVEAVADFVAALEAGCDYVQGSRYAPGGEAINTPTDRWIAGRLIHAPLLSFGAGTWLTDTTNGFRAYSRAYLEDRRVAPFRDDFSRYGLLFYLTVRAKRLGYRVKELPVRRAYPDAGKTPTKINGLASRLALLGEAVDAATGGYTPAGAPRQHPLPARPGAAALLWAALAGLMLLTATLWWNRLPLSPDSWTLVELSRTIGGDFFRIRHLRAYGEAAAYSASFPPLYPMLLALGDWLGGLGARSGFAVNLIAFALFAFLSERAGRRLFAARWIGLGAALATLCHYGMLDELVAGRTMPVQLALYAGYLLLLTRDGAIGAGRAALMGLIGGLLVMNRFDAAPVVLLLALSLFALARPAAALVQAGVAALTVSPWIVHSLARFGTPFRTDHGAVSLSADPEAYVTDWWPAPRPGLADAPGDWVAGIFGNFVAMPGIVLAGIGMAGALAMLALVAPAWLFSWLVRRGGPRDLLAGRARLTLFAVALTALVAGPLLTGYADGRYFVPLFWAGGLILAGLALVRLRADEQRDLAGFALVVPLLALAAFAVANEARSKPLHPGFPDRPGDAAIARCLALEETPGAILFPDAEAREGARLSALNGWRTAIVPRNFARLTPDERIAFARLHGITHVHAGPAARPALAGQIGLAPAPGCPPVIARIAP